MKKVLLASLVALPLVTGLTGCVIAVGGDDERGHYSYNDHDRAYKNRQAISKISLGSSFADTQNRLGVADFNETFKEGDDLVKVLFYRTHRVHKDDLTTKDECTYLKFVNGELVSIGAGEEFARG
ncbi:DUF3192 domain-containing protein [Endozoicomonas sp. G2_1]|uniref:DUF3192 domain-containing protein n=1 Tax=Endozoicomonas sp. G2_1 TaxID=2821091 RepID=UPI001ADB1191|nr:DUF3192 domain-containing protein [Endozoicomonas sp. G2_1]MBO9488880.1 DUF3192 domain-containing protein [Endozoicomonas sp. G2_1]